MFMRRVSAAVIARPAALTRRQMAHPAQNRGLAPTATNTIPLTRYSPSQNLQILYNLKISQLLLQP